MNAEHTSNSGQGNGIAFLIGVVYNLLTQLNFTSLLEHSVEMMISGVAFFLAKALVEKMIPWVKGQLKKLWDFLNGE